MKGLPLVISQLTVVCLSITGANMEQDDGDYCDICGADLTDGEGYDGKCGSCADAESEEE